MELIKLVKEAVASLLINNKEGGVKYDKSRISRENGNRCWYFQGRSIKRTKLFHGWCNKGAKEKDGKVTLVGFGTFSKIRRKARKGRNPQTGEPIKIKACNVVKFRPGKKLKEAI